MNNKKKQYHFSNSAPLLVIWSDNNNKSTQASSRKQFCNTEGIFFLLHILVVKQLIVQCFTSRLQHFIRYKINSNLIFYINCIKCNELLEQLY